MLVRGCLFGVNNQKVNSCQAKKIWTTRESFCSEQRNFRQKIPWAQEILALPCFGQRGRLDTVWADSDARQAWNPQSGRSRCSSSHQHTSTRSLSSWRLFGPHPLSFRREREFLSYNLGLETRIKIKTILARMFENAILLLVLDGWNRTKVSLMD